MFFSTIKSLLKKIKSQITISQHTALRSFTEIEVFHIVFVSFELVE